MNDLGPVISFSRGLRQQNRFEFSGRCEAAAPDFAQLRRPSPGAGRALRATCRIAWRRPRERRPAGYDGGVGERGGGPIGPRLPGRLGMLDLVIRGARLVDGSGAPVRTGDLAVADGRLVEVGGRIRLPARRVLDADGALVTPGFIDPHTHYDAQIHWDPLVSPSSEHGVTTAVIGNCGLGLAPVREADRPALQGLMGGVEDIPQSALAAGLEWAWQDYAEYLEAIAARPLAIEIGALVGHGALRLFEMGPERAYAEPATREEIEGMARRLGDALDAGALGFSTSRSRLDRDFEGRPTPSCHAQDAELEALATVLHERHRGLVELAYRGSAGDEPERMDQELAWMRALCRLAGRPLTFGLAQLDAAPTLFRRALDQADEARAEGLEMRPQVLGRMQSVLIGLDTVHPFRHRPSYAALAHLPAPERAARLRDPALRARILAEPAGPVPDDDPFGSLFAFEPERIFPLGPLGADLDYDLDYEPGPEASLSALAAREGLEPLAALYDRIVAQAGEALLLYAVANYHAGDDSASLEMIEHPCSLLGLADGGAHSGLLCDASVPTSMLTHWTRDRRRGPRLPLERMVHKLTGEPAALFGLHDRGLLRPGLRADLNMIDFERLALEPPRVVRDLPAGARRLVQSARGYRATFVAGEAIREHGEDTGARPGGLARAQPGA